MPRPLVRRLGKIELEVWELSVVVVLSKLVRFKLLLATHRLDAFRGHDRLLGRETVEITTLAALQRFMEKENVEIVTMMDVAVVVYL
jgi:hypothetical protein